jgi:hypothetical protein
MKDVAIVGVERIPETASLLIRIPSSGPLLGVRRSSDRLRIRRKR